MFKQKQTQNGLKVRFIALTMVVMCAGVLGGAGAIASSESTKHDCNQDRYIKIAEQVLKFSAQTPIVLEKDKQPLPTACLQTTSNEPLDVDVLQFSMPLKLEGHDPFNLSVTLRRLEPYATSNRTFYEEMLADLQKKGKTLKDLPIIGGFYKYLHHEGNSALGQANLYYYFAVDQSMHDAEGIPLMFWMCPTEQWPLSCSPYFNWKPNLNVKASFGIGREVRIRLPFDIWKTIYPRIIVELNKFKN